jgi:hypothetical protein
MDGKSVAAAHIHKRIRGAAMLIFPPRHMHMRLVSALSAARGVCVCSSARRQKSCTLRHTLASVDIWNSACWLCRRSSSCANIDTIVHSRRWQWWDCLLVVAIAFRNVAGVFSTEPRATAWTLCAVLLSMPSIVSRLKTSLPSAHNEPITCTINGWHPGAYSTSLRADLRARAVPAIINSSRVIIIIIIDSSPLIVRSKAWAGEQHSQAANSIRGLFKHTHTGLA